MRYFVFYKNEKPIAKASSNFKPMINRWLKDVNAKEVSKDKYEFTDTSNCD